MITDPCGGTSPTIRFVRAVDDAVETGDEQAGQLGRGFVGAIGPARIGIGGLKALEILHRHEHEPRLAVLGNARQARDGLRKERFAAI